MGEPQTFQLETEIPYTGTVTWYINGEKQTATGFVFMPTFNLPGRKVITAQLTKTHEKIEVVRSIQSFQHIVLESLVPNPFSPDPEEIVLRNNNDFVVLLRHWRFQSQTSVALVSINETIPPHSTVTLRVERKLINNAGAYGLYNEADQLVDGVSYGSAPPGARLIRTQTRWYFPDSDVIEFMPEGSQAASVPDSQAMTTEPITFRVGSALPLLVARSVGIRIWINLLIGGGTLLLLSSWLKKSV